MLNNKAGCKTIAKGEQYCLLHRMQNLAAKPTPMRGGLLLARILHRGCMALSSAPLSQVQSDQLKAIVVLDLAVGGVPPPSTGWEPSFPASNRAGEATSPTFCMKK